IFPAARKLDQDQLVALLVHEGLHRALPPSVREDESKVAAITLAITSPGANQDGIRVAVLKHVPEADLAPVAAVAAGPAPEPEKYPIPEDAAIREPSLVGYSYSHFGQPTRAANFPITSMHTVKSYLYPFGSDRVPLGLGIEASLLGLKETTQSGPLGLSARLRLWSGRGFDVGIWGTTSLNMLSANELKNSPFGRDIGTVGISLRKDLSRFYVENFLGLSFNGSSTREIANVTYNYDYGKIINVSTHVGARIGKLHLGGYAELFLSDYFRISESGGSAFDPSFDSGRFRVLAAGPELSWREKGFQVSLAGRYLVDATQGADFDFLGNIMGAGVAQGNITAGVSLFF
ncbi:MAG TPA: hypothetical protein VM598_13005, partial [Bdellovibrionota bacterium]|nr:hypothetical protein [Bdellovibrionota bacterium]